MRYARWIVGLAALGAAIGAVNWLAGDGDTARLRAERDRLQQEVRVLNQVVDRLTREERVAEVVVLDQRPDAETGRPLTEIEFIELDRDGHALPSRRFCVPGREPYFDALVIKFDDKYVAAGDALRGKSILLFQRVFSEMLAPQDGPRIDPANEIPDVFRVDRNPSPFEQNLWKRFWSYATDRKLAESEGIRVAQGEAVHAPMKPGQRWTLTLEADGGLNLYLTEMPRSAGPTGAPAAAPSAASPTADAAMG